MKTYTQNANLRAYIGGTFDILHAGHINLISKVERLGILPIISINSDKFVMEYRHKPCIYKEDERLHAIREFYPMYVSFLVDRENQAEVIKENNVDFIVVGTDWMKEGILQQLCITEDFLHTNNINMLFIPRYKSISSNEIKTRVINNV